MSTCSTTKSLIDRLDDNYRQAKFRSELLRAFFKAIEKAEEDGRGLGVMAAVESLLDCGSFVTNETDANLLFTMVDSLDPAHARVFAHVSASGFVVEIMPPQPFDGDCEFIVRISQILLSKQIGLCD